MLLASWLPPLIGHERCLNWHSPLFSGDPWCVKLAANSDKTAPVAVASCMSAQPVLCGWRWQVLHKKKPNSADHSCRSLSMFKQVIWGNYSPRQGASRVVFLIYVLSSQKNVHVPQEEAFDDLGLPCRSLFYSPWAGYFFSLSWNMCLTLQLLFNPSCLHLSTPSHPFHHQTIHLLHPLTRLYSSL